MSDLFYNVVRYTGSHVFFLTSRAVVIGDQHVRRHGAFIVAATHSSPYDVPILIRHTHRMVDFVSTVEVFGQGRLFAAFYRALNAFPLDRSRPDGRTVRTILDRLARGRVVAMFPEGGIRKEQHAVYVTRKIKPGIGRIANLAGVPIVPVVIQNSIAYARPTSWLPIRRVRYGVIYGEPLMPGADDAETERCLVDEYVALHARLVAAMGGHPPG
jgi:1-acyl-sn-glycerol-3-phosphate acyltransferase